MGLTWNLLAAQCPKPLHNSARPLSLFLPVHFVSTPPPRPSSSLHGLCSGSSGSLAEATTVLFSCLLGSTCVGGPLTALPPSACTSPLGMQTGAIADSQISASSMHLGFMGLQRWAPELARLYQTGIVNAWTSSNYDKNPWIQVWKG